MKTFRCKKLRLCVYLMDRGFVPYSTVPNTANPKYSVYLFEETPELTAAVVRYFAVDCYTAQEKNKQKELNHEESKSKRTHHRKEGI